MAWKNNYFITYFIVLLCVEVAVSGIFILFYFLKRPKNVQRYKTSKSLLQHTITSQKRRNIR